MQGSPQEGTALGVVQSKLESGTPVDPTLEFKPECTAGTALSTSVDPTHTHTHTHKKTSSSGLSPIWLSVVGLPGHFGKQMLVLSSTEQRVCNI